MHILLSNDDGVHASGLSILEKQLSLLSEVTVLAPDRNRSGASNSLTLNSPLTVRQLANGYFSVEGTPTDCVHLALTGFLDPVFDIVVSGINEGFNLGDDILYSGTVAAAMEGRNLGLPAIAVSIGSVGPIHYETAAIITSRLVQTLARARLPAQTILNVNIPNPPINEIQGYEVTRLGTRHSAEPVVRASDPRGRAIYWIGPPGQEADAGEGTDFHAITRARVSITPLHLDMTHYKIFSQLSGLLGQVDFSTP